MRRLSGFLLAACSVLPAGAPARRWNTYEMPVASGAAEVEWISASSFRLTRTWSSPNRARRPVKTEAVPVTVSETPAGFRYGTRYLTVDIESSGDRMSILLPEGPRLTANFRRDGTTAVAEQSALPGERFYGLAAQAEQLDLRGQKIVTKNAFLVSGMGYAEYYPGPGSFTFDLGASTPDMRRVTRPGGEVEFYFHYGPTPKEIFEEHLAIREDEGDSGAEFFDLRESRPEAAKKGTWQDLASALRNMFQASFSGTVAAPYDLAPYQSAAHPLADRAIQLGSILPALYARKAALSEAQQAAIGSQRRRFMSYLLSYAFEGRVRGVPFVRPLALQLPDDRQGLSRTSEFMLGDELLIVPVLSAESKLSFYLPPGLWTELETNQIYKGRQQMVIDAPAGRLPVFARNGTIVPLDPPGSAGLLELHYYPRLGAEFFLYEEGLADISQFHAAPAGDLMRLEMEGLKDRTYEWVLHHVSNCKKIESGGREFAEVKNARELKAGSWYIDRAAGNTHIQVRGKAGADQVVNISF